MLPKRYTVAALATSVLASSFLVSTAHAVDLPMPDKNAAGSTSTAADVTQVSPSSPEGVFRTLKAQLKAENDSRNALTKSQQMWKTAVANKQQVRALELETAKARRHLSAEAKAASRAIKKPDVTTIVTEGASIAAAVGLSNPQAKAEYQERVKDIQSRYEANIAAAKVMHAKVSEMYGTEKELSKLRRDATAYQDQIQKTTNELNTVYGSRVADSKALSSLLSGSLGYKGDLAAQVKQFESDLSSLPEESRLRLTLKDMKALVAKPCVKEDSKLVKTYSNGSLDSKVLCDIAGYKNQKLRPTAARDFAAMSAAFERKFGKKINITDSYRSLDEQIDVKRRKGWLAAKPGTSNHGWGLATDLGGGIQEFDSAEHQWMVDNAHLFRFYLPDWAQEGGSKPEPWHWEHITVQLEKEAAEAAKVSDESSHNH